MRIKFHGPLGIVTGSCYELKDHESQTHFLVDCGIQQGEPTADEWNSQPFPFVPSSLDFVLLTHAHMDHCGLIPRLYNEGFTGLVYATEATRDITRINLEDGAKHSRHYSKEDVDAIKWATFSGQELNREHRRHGLRITFRRTAHILGAVSIRVSWGLEAENNQIIFSGDIGNNSNGNEFQSLARHRVGPFKPRGERSYAVMESTYGSRCRSLHHHDFQTRISTLRKHILEAVLDKQGSLIMPCFAIGRTQEVLFDLHYVYASTPELSDVPLIFDACMARKISTVFARELQRREDSGFGDEPVWLSQQLLEWMEMEPTTANEVLLAKLVAATLDPSAEIPPEAQTHPSKIVQAWSQHSVSGTRRGGEVVVPAQPSIIVTGGGMCDGGLVAQYLPKLLTSEKNTVLLTGYCGPSTNGGKLLAIQNTSIQKRAELVDSLSWPGSTTVPVSSIRANVSLINGYSGHADQAGLADWFFNEHRGQHYAAGNHVFLTHGSDASRRDLANFLGTRARELGLAEISFERPTTKDGWFDLDTGDWLLDEVALFNEVAHRFSQLTTGKKEFVLGGLMDLLGRLP